MSGAGPWAVAPARRLAVLRILVGLYALGYILGRAPALLTVVRYPAGQFRPVGPVAMLSAPLPAVVVVLLVVCCTGLAAAYVVGWRFRVTGPAFAVVFLWVLSYRNSWGMLFHTENLLWLHVWVVGFARAADALSVDARGRGSVADSPRYGWPIFLMCAVTTLTYFLAGWAKLEASGWHWATDDTLRSLVAYDNVRKAELGDFHSPLAALVLAYDWMFPPLASVSLAVELGAPLALVGRRVGMVWVSMAWGFHIGVLLLMFILFHYQVLGIAYASFFRVERIADRVERIPAVKRWLSRRDEVAASKETSSEASRASSETSGTDEG